MRTDGYMPPSDGWVPPSSKKLHKLPTIHIGNQDVANRIEKWYDENEEADNLLPPYKDYIIHYKKSELQHDIIVHYQENLRELHAQLITNGKKRELVYTNFDIREKGNKLVPEGEVPDTREYDCKHIKLIAEQVIGIIILTQAYILNFMPEVVEKEKETAGVRVQQNVKQNNTSRDKKIKQVKTKYIYLNGHEHIPKEKEYRKIQWSVRGHFRHVGDKVIYIKPHTAKRGEKKLKEGRVIIE